MIKVRFWGVRGSVPAPLTGAEVYEKHCELFKGYMEDQSRINWKEYLDTQPLWKKATYGGNTSCVEVLCDNKRIVLDMGTGLRMLGKNIMEEMFLEKGLSIIFLLSHIHWDHVQGLPFFAPLYVNKESGIRNSWTFFGGTDWMKTAEVCLRGQMDPPTFPVSWLEIEKITHRMEEFDVYDCMSFNIGTIRVTTRRLNHPQETYGWRIEYQDKIIAYTTDNEPFDPRHPDPRLLELARDADIWITDCQYSHGQYHGRNGGPARYGWGHSYPEAVATTVNIARPKRVLLFHHDPAAKDLNIYHLECEVRNEIKVDTEVLAAYEGLEITL